ncbi:GPP34 family phosphoprotein [Kitasatospora sp. NPDC036755]|uniref:GOLPH3/VPS74 family protein n=1 Tax=Kitasatospora sp. NPDC036755 TaxID=3154600 RepID=UPI0033F1953F
MTPLEPPEPPGPPGDRPLMDELVLLCNSPGPKWLNSSPTVFERMIAGAVLADLLLTGAITIEDRWITGFNPFGARDGAGEAVLGRLSRVRKGRRSKLDSAVRWIPPRETARYYQDRLVAQGVMTVEHRRLLLRPYRALLPVRASAAQEITDRIVASLERTGAGSAGPGERDLQLAGLLWAGSHDVRLRPWRERAAFREATRRAARDLPIAQAVRRVIDADRSAGNGGS